MENKYNLKAVSRQLLLKYLFTIFLIFGFYYQAKCQESVTKGSVFRGGSYENTFSTARIGTAQSVMTVPQGEFHVVIQHRFSEVSGGIYSLFGLDGALTRLGFDYGISNWLSAGFGRSLFEITYDLELKASILKQNKSNIPVSLSYYVSVLDNTQKNFYPVGYNSFGSHLSFVNQLIAARNQGIFSVQVSPMWVHSNFEVRTGSPLNIFAVDLDGRVKLFERIGLIAEYIPVLTNQPFIQTNPFTVGMDINTGGHQFQLIFSNSQGTNEKSILSNTAGNWSKGHIYFGFNLTRVFNSKML
jgi:hypothetical protein